MWFWSFRLGLDAAKWKQCADHRAGQTEGMWNLWSFTGVDLTTTVGPLRERGINFVSAIKTQSWGKKKEKPLLRVGWVKDIVNSKPVPVCVPLKTPSLGLSPDRLTCQFYGLTESSCASRVRGGIRAETVTDR